MPNELCLLWTYFCYICDGIDNAKMYVFREFPQQKYIPRNQIEGSTILQVHLHTHTKSKNVMALCPSETSAGLVQIAF